MQADQRAIQQKQLAFNRSGSKIAPTPKRVAIVLFGKITHSNCYMCMFVVLTQWRQWINALYVTRC